MVEIADPDIYDPIKDEVKFRHLPPRYLCKQPTPTAWAPCHLRGVGSFSRPNTR